MLIKMKRSTDVVVYGEGATLGYYTERGCIVTATRFARNGRKAACKLFPLLTSHEVEAWINS